MKSQKRILALVLIISSLQSCQLKKDVSFEEEKEKIMAMHHAQRDYHFNKDSIAFADQHSENFISVNRGQITRPKREASITKYNRYFSSVEFLKWDDVSEPIIKISDDGTMAYTIVDKIVTLTYQDESGETVEGSTHFAWTTIYKKYGDEWKIECVTSTNKPEEE
ncbi:protein of unknown function [Reichenbachiella faecimaris]|uniref:DUF4440 domain-containing protein n=1 Tax=Reichenbachiella faecimaris TaxID=692418 RepID=A0A1W2GE97_REIFA|nr:nuclear transport factor 2 family protein [Reichenbachiella faecimaris]SMD34658.1 protein of unknown function [Reichenbachiella faecimaris]